MASSEAIQIRVFLLCLVPAMCLPYQPNRADKKTDQDNAIDPLATFLLLMSKRRAGDSEDRVIGDSSGNIADIADPFE